LEILELNVTYLDYVVRGKIELAMRQWAYFVYFCLLRDFLIIKEKKKF
jgi:hypothetical protein